MIEKTCKHCKTTKPLGEFFAAPHDGRAEEHRTSTYCRQCHSTGKIPHGYGWYAGYDTPESKPEPLQVSWIK